MRRLVVLATLAIGGCRTLSPPPNVMRHASTLPMPEGAVALSAIIGIGESGFLSFAAGLELRVGYQASADMEVGVGVGVGRSEEVPVGADPDLPMPNTDDDPLKPKPDDAPKRSRNIWGGQVRAYTSVTPAGERMALTSGLGLTMLSTGLVAFTVDTGITFGHPNDSVVPYGTAFIALSMPIRRGIEFGSSPDYPTTSLYVGGLFGFGIPRGAHFLSLESGYAQDVRNSKIGVFALSLGERYVR